MALKSTPVPRTVDLLESGRRVAIVWQDGQATEHDAFALRAACPCAGCVDELTGRRMIAPSALDPDVSVRSWTRVGRYALQFVWSDGHSTGIYPYENLRKGLGMGSESEDTT